MTFTSRDNLLKLICDTGMTVGGGDYDTVSARIAYNPRLSSMHEVIHVVREVSKSRSREEALLFAIIEAAKVFNDRVNKL